MTGGTIAILAVIVVVVAMIAGVIWWATRTDRRRSDELHRRVAAAPPESLDRDDEWPGRQRGTDVYHGATVADEFTGDYPDASDRQRWTDGGGPADRLPPRIVRDPRRFDAAYGPRQRRPIARTDDGSPRGPYEPLAVPGEGYLTLNPPDTPQDPPRSYDPAADTHVVDPSTWARPGLQPGEPVTGVSELDRTYGSPAADPSPPPSPPPDPSPPSPPPSYDPPSTYDHGGYSTGSSGGTDYGGPNYGS